MKKIKLFLFSSFGVVLLIFLLGSFLRFANLANNPPSLNWDEVAFAYNAHSIITTGKDEFGKSYPVYFRSLDDYKLPVYVYMSVISEKVFGYNNFAVRFPSAFFGSLTIIVVYFLSQILFKQKYVSLLAALLFAVIPWHIQFSRMAAESTVGLFLFLTGILFFFYSLKKKKWFLLLSFLFFALSQYTYLTFRFITPLLVILLVILYHKELIKKNIYVYATAGLVIIFSCLLAYDSYANRTTSRTAGIAAVNPDTDQFMQDEIEMQRDGELGINMSRRILHDSHLFSSSTILSRNYLAHFSPEFLFFNMHHNRDYVPGTGLLYLWMLPFIIGGIILLTKVSRKSTVVIGALFLLTPIPAAFVFDSPNAIRTIALTVPFCMIISFSIYWLGKKLYRNKVHFVGYVLFISGIFLLGIFHFYHQNTIHLPHERSAQWQYGREEMTEYILKHQGEYDKIIVSTKLEWPNVFFLYYSKYDPQKYLAQGGTVSGSWETEKNTIDNIEFRTFSFNRESQNKEILFIGVPKEFPKEVKPTAVIHYLNGKPAIYIVAGQ